jgi:hypothetical protein
MCKYLPASTGHPNPHAVVRPLEAGPESMDARRTPAIVVVRRAREPRERVALNHQTRQAAGVSSDESHDS